jgi:hypothetical protein
MKHIIEGLILVVFLLACAVLILSGVLFYNL